MVVMTVLPIGVGDDCDNDDEGEDYDDDVIVNVYDDGDVDYGDAFLVSWHRCIDLISLYMHAPSGLTREARLSSTCLKQAGQ